MPNKEDVVKYFNEKALAYDDVDQQHYWVLSDQFFRKVLEIELKHFFDAKQEVEMIDAGAGTGRWSMILEDLFGSKIKHGVLVDISEKMLKEAIYKINNKGLKNKYSCIQGDIENLDFLKNKLFDLSISFYNVLSFTENPELALQQIYQKLKIGGVCISVVANKYHSYYFSILTDRQDEINSTINDSMIRFNDSMPAIHCFTPTEIKDLYTKIGFKKVNVFGGLNFIYPGMDETKINGNTDKIINKLSNKKNFENILNLELNNYRKPDVVGRGNVLLVIAYK